MYCTTCESEVPDGSKYCPGCAMPVAVVETQAEAETVAEETEALAEELAEEVAEVIDEPTPAEVELEIVQAHETGETERAQIAADAAVDTASIEASVAVPVAEAEADEAAAVAEAVIAAEVVPPVDSGEGGENGEAAIEESAEGFGGVEEISAEGGEGEPEEESLDPAPTVMHPWFRQWWQ